MCAQFSIDTWMCKKLKGNSIAICILPIIVDKIWKYMLNTISYAQIFLDMAVLVDAQGDLLDNIETQVFYQNLKA